MYVFTLHVVGDNTTSGVDLSLLAWLSLTFLDFCKVYLALLVVSFFIKPLCVHLIGVSFLYIYYLNFFLDIT